MINDDDDTDDDDDHDDDPENIFMVMTYRTNKHYNYTLLL
jgi:hypothetical protein